jgi:sugar/nucleoside kinase (ribokinase family)
VVKKGEHGCILAHRDGLAALPAYPAETVVDPTGAGDSFAGGMMGTLANLAERGEDVRSFEAIRRALASGTVIASFTIEDFSLGRLERLTRAEIDWRAGEFARMLRVG